MTTMCDCDCELPKEKRWQQIRDEALTGTNTVAPSLPPGTWLVVDGKARRASVDTQGYAGPQVHLIVTHEPWGEDDDDA